MTREPGWRARCETGPVLFVDKRAAAAELRTMLRNPNVPQQDKIYLHVYPCSACGMWHVGKDRFKQREVAS